MCRGRSAAEFLGGCSMVTGSDIRSSTSLCMSVRCMSVVFVLLEVACASAEARSLQEIHYRTAADGTMQPAMFYAPEQDGPVPLVVALHTWSGNWKQTTHQPIAEWCIEKHWAYIHPDFRGPNRRPEATGSPLVVADIVSAVEYAKKAARIDEKAVFLVGTSGGGYTALLVVGQHPEIWAGVSVWVPIVDLRSWYYEAPDKYRRDIAASCGGPPGASDQIDRQYRARSPITYLANAKGVRVHINAGIRDGHTGSVPVSHSLRAFNELAAAEDRLSPEEIRYFVQRAAVPPHLASRLFDPSYGARQPLFRRTSGNVTVTIFDGGHELVPQAATAWLEKLYLARKAYKAR